MERMDIFAASDAIPPEQQRAIGALAIATVVCWESIEHVGYGDRQHLKAFHESDEMLRQMVIVALRLPLGVAHPLPDLADFGVVGEEAGDEG